jgi:hypothetical protein
VLAVGFVFANGLSLMANGAQMLAIFDAGAHAGAVRGLALNVGDPTLIPRWLMMLGLGVTTTAAYLLLDAVVFATRETADYRLWARRWAFRIHTLGLGLFGAMGTWYLFGALPAGTRQAVFASPLPYGLAMLSALLPVVAWGLAWRASRAARGADLVVAVQLTALVANVAARQWVQSREIAAVYEPASVPLKVQSGPLAVFLVLFVAGLALTGWLVRVWIRAARGEARP